MANKIVIGIDQSYKDSGISVAYNGELKTSTHCYTDNLKTNTEKRRELKRTLVSLLDKIAVLSHKHNADVVVIIERIRLQSQGFININYIKSIGALNALIVDTASLYDFPVYSVDTRAWKSAIVGTSKSKSNKYGFDPKKWPTILWCVSQGYKEYIIEEVSPKKQNGVIIRNGKRFTYNDNISDSICISLYGFVNRPLLKVEH